MFRNSNLNIIFRLISLFLIISLGPNLYSQPTDLEVFSKNAESFNCYLNGDIQNLSPQSNIEMLNLPSGYYELMLTFPTNPDTVFRRLGLSPGVKTTYLVKRNRKGKLKLKFAGESPLSTSIYPTTHNQPKSKRPVPPPIDNCGNLTGGFDQIRNLQIKTQGFQFDEQKVQQIRQELLGGCFNSFQLAMLFTGFKDEQYKVQLAKILIDVTYDLENAHLYLTSFPNDHHQQEVKAYLESLKQQKFNE